MIEIGWGNISLNMYRFFDLGNEAFPVMILTKQQFAIANSRINANCTITGRYCIQVMT